MQCKRPPAMQEIWVPSLGQEKPPENEMPAHSSILAWTDPQREEPVGLQSMASHELDTT